MRLRERRCNHQERGWRAARKRVVGWGRDVEGCISKERQPCPPCFPIWVPLSTITSLPHCLHQQQKCMITLVAFFAFPRAPSLNLFPLLYPSSLKRFFNVNLLSCWTTSLPFFASNYHLLSSPLRSYYFTSYITLSIASSDHISYYMPIYAYFLLILKCDTM